MSACTPGKCNVRWISLGQMDYDEALTIQQKRNQALLQGIDDWQTVYSVEHPPTITIGRNGTEANIVASDKELSEIGFTIRHVDRGGDVTYHGPGQLVIYPILHLSPWQNDVSLYVRYLEEMVIQALAEVDLQGSRMDEYPGVWIGNRKICAVGARMKKRPSGEFVTSHGIALNVSTNLQHFDAIIPCGIQGKGVTSISAELHQEASYSEWEQRLQRSFTSIFACDLIMTDSFTEIPL